MEALHIDRLLGDHAERIERLQNMVEDVLPNGGVTKDGIKIDEVFFLRYILSNKNKPDEKIEEKIRYNLNWRQGKDAPSWLMSIADEGNAEPVTSEIHHHPQEEEIYEYLYSAYTGDLKNGEAISVVRLGISDIAKLMKKFGNDVITDFLVYEKEKVFRTCDSRSRQSGTLVKAITVIDFDEFSIMGKRFSRSFFNSLGESSTLASKLYPQMQAKTVVVNMGNNGMLFNLLSAVMPKSAMDKLVKCGAKGGTDNKPGTSCPYLTNNDGLSAVPPFLGGTAKTPEALLPPNDRGRTPMTKLKLKARSKKKISIEIPKPNSIVEFEAEINAHHVIVSAEVVTKDKPRYDMRFGFPATELRDTNDLVNAKWQLPDPGTLVITFDNSFSKIRKKTVMYRATLLDPEADEAKQQTLFEKYQGILNAWKPTEANFSPVDSVVEEFSSCTLS